ncbi:uncharacterized protein SCODWIG_00244 [Saccharomycodes ludwigii]|uniref:Structure-specific endonuclease subunit SLX4 n=1 Tax=Saccharomycodes ludwigii TaxID=36035 RepID=A0A376B1E0_9ASCO|nr:hypothetical protein SCDLUD_001773 [Saccharomycodes ludwigii]KAH3901985.1 hypothetical protein SCDLUD_001773 [Saccharomycodes ludwigii]SSD58483.1 uncharacterized protein SCODWIG_00244 [Saccharomycodes ludwigii]
MLLEGVQEDLTVTTTEKRRLELLYGNEEEREREEKRGTNTETPIFNITKSTNTEGSETETTDVDGSLVLLETQIPNAMEHIHTSINNSLSSSSENSSLDVPIVSTENDSTTNNLQKYEDLEKKNNLNNKTSQRNDICEEEKNEIENDDANDLVFINTQIHGKLEELNDKCNRIKRFKSNLQSYNHDNSGNTNKAICKESSFFKKKDLKTITSINTMNYLNNKTNNNRKGNNIRRDSKSSKVIALLSGKKNKIKDVFDKILLKKDNTDNTNETNVSLPRERTTYDEDEWLFILQLMKENLMIQPSKEEILTLRKELYSEYVNKRLCNASNDACEQSESPLIWEKSQDIPETSILYELYNENCSISAATGTSTSRNNQNRNNNSNILMSLSQAMYDNDTKSKDEETNTYTNNIPIDSQESLSSDLSVIENSTAEEEGSKIFFDEKGSNLDTLNTMLNNDTQFYTPFETPFRSPSKSAINSLKNDDDDKNSTYNGIKIQVPATRTNTIGSTLAPCDLSFPITTDIIANDNRKDTENTSSTSSISVIPDSQDDEQDDTTLFIQEAEVFISPVKVENRNRNSPLKTNSDKITLFVADSNTDSSKKDSTPPPKASELRIQLKEIGLKTRNSSTSIMLESLELFRSQSYSSKNDIFDEITKILLLKSDNDEEDFLQKIYCFQPLSFNAFHTYLKLHNSIFQFVDESTIKEWADNQGICFK